MLLDTVLFVSKRAAVVAAALICLAAGRLALQLSSGPDTGAGATEVRVAITR